MSKIVIEGGYPLNGQVHIQGSKNAVLPILAASIINGGENIIHNCPKIKDVFSTIKILEQLGCTVLWDENTLIINSADINDYIIPENLMREMRSSIIFLGALLARFSRAKLSTPGGCELGPRPIDLHLKAFKQLGVLIDDSHGYISCMSDRLKGKDIHLDFPSVGATENIMLISSLSKGITTISNAAKEPEIIDLQNFLNKMGAKISGAGTGFITIKGAKELNNVEHTIIPDRIVASSYLAAVASASGNIILYDVIPKHLQSTISIFKESGCSVICDDNCISIDVPKRIKAVDFIRTLPYPGFPTDAQALVVAALCTAEGTTVVTENMFESRFKYIAELNRMCADIKIDGKTAIIKGVKHLSGAVVNSTDLRGAAALVVAGLNAEGITVVNDTSHLDRGYENFEEGLHLLGAKIKRMD